MTPSKRARGAARRDGSESARRRRRTSALNVSSSATPPASLLWLTPARKLSAPPGSRCRRRRGRLVGVAPPRDRRGGIPAPAGICFDSTSERAVRAGRGRTRDYLSELGCSIFSSTFRRIAEVRGVLKTVTGDRRPPKRSSSPCRIAEAALRGWPKWPESTSGTTRCRRPTTSCSPPRLGGRRDSEHGRRPASTRRQSPPTPRLAVISNLAVGLDNIDLRGGDPSRESRSATRPGVSTETTADLAFALLMAAARRVAEGDRYVRAAAGAPWTRDLMLGRDLFGATLGIIGFGCDRAGDRAPREWLQDARFCTRLVSIIARAVGWRFTPRANRSSFRAAGRVGLYIDHVPLTDKTRHMLGAREFADHEAGGDCRSMRRAAR